MQRLWSTARSPSHDYGSVAHDDSLLIGIPPIVITGAGHPSTDGGDRSTRRCHRDGATSAPPPLARCHLTRPLFAELIGYLMGDGSIRGSTVELRGCSYLEIRRYGQFLPHASRQASILWINLEFLPSPQLVAVLES